jgi:hypothetical protein
LPADGWSVVEKSKTGLVAELSMAAVSVHRWQGHKDLVA